MYSEEYKEICMSHYTTYGEARDLLMEEATCSPKESITKCFFDYKVNGKRHISSISCFLHDVLNSLHSSRYMLTTQRPDMYMLVNDIFMTYYNEVSVCEGRRLDVRMDDSVDVILMIRFYAMRVLGFRIDRAFELECRKAVKLPIPYHRSYAKGENTWGYVDHITIYI